MPQLEITQDEKKLTDNKNKMCEMLIIRYLRK